MTIEDFTIGKLMIGEREYEVKDCELLQSELMFYVDNPRVYSALRNSPDIIPTQAEIEKHMIELESVKQLRLSIHENGGLIDPLIVRDGDFVVLEGNSRLAAYRILCRNEPLKWGKVKCRVLPADIDEAAIFKLLGTYHIVGRKDWSPYEQAGYLYRRFKDTKIPEENLASELGITPAKAKNYIRVYDYMLEKEDLAADRWSYYEELLKNRKLQSAIKDNPGFEEVLVEQIKTNQIVNAADIRKVGEMAAVKTKKGKKVFQGVVAGTTDIYSAYASLKDESSFDKVADKVSAYKEFISDPKLVETIMASQQKDRIIYDIKVTGKRIKALLQVLGEK